VESVIRIDTHVAVWLYAGLHQRFSDTAAHALRTHDLAVSPMVQLELTFLHEIGRISVSGAEIIADLGSRLGLRLSDVPMIEAIHAATTLSWTRDPFDRVIVADALTAGSRLVTCDRVIAANTAVALW
jgi:PIN domain nuclease of toxin-antitoxin system